MTSNSAKKNGSQIKKTALIVIAASALVIGFMPSISLAVTCTVDTGFNPDPFITGSSGSCGLGSGNNDTAALLDSVVPGSATYTYIDRDIEIPGQASMRPISPLPVAITETGLLTVMDSTFRV